ncbi:hypothetical protein ACNOYE_36030 [Nannocystaceae bacterium ST9]
MGSSRMAWLRRRTPIALAFALICPSACSLDDLPPCGAIEIAPAQPRGLTTPSPTVMAISDGSKSVTVLRSCSALADCGDADLREQKVEVTAPPEQILLTGSGRWLTYVTNRHELHRIDLDADTPTPSAVAVEFDRVELVGSLRGGDWILYRGWSKATNSDPEALPPTHASELFARYVGSPGGFPFDHEAKTIRIDAGQFRVAAVGHRNLVVRKSLGNDREELYLVRIAPSFRSDEHGSSQIGETLLLARGKSFQRVIVTSGQTPRELGDKDAFPTLPNDLLVIATSGDDEDARTVVYDIRDLGLVANFEGEVATSLLPLHDVPGLSGLSPDSSHLAYLTKRGALALRNLDTQTSCELRSAEGDGHVMAGFAADGTLYFESREDDILDDPDPRIREFDRVYAYDTASATHTLISESPYRRPLRAVPQWHPAGLPWAIFSSSGSSTVSVPGTGMGMDAIGFEFASFLSPDDQSLWVLGAAASDGDELSYETELMLRRIHMSANGQIEAQGPSVGDQDFFRLSYSSSDRICVSLAQSTRATPWATQCSDQAGDRTRWLSDKLPFSEQQF